MKYIAWVQHQNTVTGMDREDFIHGTEMPWGFGQEESDELVILSNEAFDFRYQMEKDKAWDLDD